MSPSSSQDGIWVNRPPAKASTLGWTDPPAAQNPTVRGPILHYGAMAIANLPFVQNVLWRNAGFAALRDRAELEDDEPRYDPTVVRTDAVSADGAEALVPPPLFSSSLAEDWTAKTGNARVYRSIVDFHHAYRDGRVTPVDVARELLGQIKKGGKHAVAFLEVREDLVMKAAEESAERWRRGEPLSVLDGVPLACKDEVDVAGYKKCYGSLLDFTPEHNATSFCVQKWQDAGAVLMGKTLMHELGSDTTNNNPNYGTPRNPNNEQYYCGGSSGGSAYAVAAGLMPLCEGNDGGGSIRIPANYCGLYGLKTSHSRVSKRPSLNLARSTGVCGPLAASMVDLEIGYRFMAQPDPLDPDSALFPPPKPISLTQPRKKILGIYQPWLDRADAVVKKTIQNTIAHLTATQGYTTVPVTVPLLHEGQLAHAMTILSELCTGVNPRDHHKLTGPNKVLLSVARHTTSVDFLQAQRLRQLLMSHLSALFATHPGLILVTPTTPNAGWPIHPADLRYGVSNGNQQIRNMEYVWLANFTGCPAISCPVGYADPAVGTGRVPVGVMGMAEWCDEEGLLGFGYDCERYVAEALEGGREKPGNWTDVLDLATARSAAESGKVASA